MEGYALLAFKERSRQLLAKTSEQDKPRDQQRQGWRHLAVKDMVLALAYLVCSHKQLNKS